MSARPVSHVVLFTAPLLAIAVLAGCSGSRSAAAGTFRPSAGVRCMNHQVTGPTSADRSATADIGQRLVVLRYYTAHGQQPYCDGRPASDTDVAWMWLYVAGGAQRSLVARWLGP